MKCPECGIDVGADEKFCGNCGAPLQTPQAPASEAAVVTGSEAAEPELSLAEAEPPSAPPAIEPDPVQPMPAPAVEPELPEYAAAPPPPPPAVTPSKGKSNTGLIIGIAVLALLLLCCCCVLIVGAIYLPDIANEIDSLYTILSPVLTTFA